MTVTPFLMKRCPKRLKGMKIYCIVHWLLGSWRVQGRAANDEGKIEVLTLEQPPSLCSQLEEKFLRDGMHARSS